jgi:acyl-CoA reductase-like NAD-dependent aldehyde dehydrogenase
MHPVNWYTGPLLARAFASLISMGVLEIVYGGVEVGQYCCKHSLVDSIHITGAAQTHDAIIWGPASEQAARKESDTPVIDKPITSELGCVSPIIVVPGVWSGDDVEFQAEHIASMVRQTRGRESLIKYVCRLFSFLRIWRLFVALSSMF